MSENTSGGIMPSTAPQPIEITLPSRGVLYGDKLPGGKVLLHPITGRQEEVMIGMGDSNMAQVLRQVLSQLADLKSLPFEELLVTDWMALVLHLLSFSYSPDITLNPRCPGCSRDLVITLQVSDLEMFTPETILQDEAIGLEKYQEPFVTPKLPLSKNTVSFRLPRIGDMEAEEKYANQMKKSKLKDSEGRVSTYARARRIVAINDHTDLQQLKIQEWLRDLVGGDSQYLKSYMDAVETGYDIRPTFRCNHCATQFKLMLPISEGSFLKSFRSEFRRSKKAKSGYNVRDGEIVRGLEYDDPLAER